MDTSKQAQQSYDAMVKKASPNSPILSNCVKLGKFCGAGTIVPITGFANSVVSPAIEFKKEGMVFGMAAKMFIVAGPVIVYGTLTSMAVGLIYYLVRVV